MDWDLKVPASWDLAELEHDAGAAAAPAAGPSGVHRVNAAVTTGGGSRAPAGNGGGRPECSVDLKLGGLGECELSGHGGDLRGRERPAAPAPAPAHASAPAAAPASSTGVAAAGVGAPRRPRPAGGGGAGQQCPSCAVDGCKADLSMCRDYHRRHKVCEAHSKTPVVVVAGREMRFCQQCSRFHQLAEFDETKRSCRKRLDGHNRRRRKPQPDPMTSANFITRQQGTRFSPFTTPRPDATWPGIIKTEESPYYTHQLPLGTSNNRQQHFGVGSSSAYTKEGRRFPFLHQEGEISFTTGMVLDAASSAVCQPLLKTVAAPPETGGGGGSKMFSDGLTRVLDSDCALSLLSAPANSSNIDVTRMVRPTEQVPLLAQQQPLLSGLQFGTASWFPRPHQPVPAPATGAVATTTVAPTGMETEHHHQQMHAVLGGGAGDAAEMNYNGMFHVAGEGTFSWQE